MRKLVFCLVLAIATALYAVVALASGGDRWSLSGDMQIVSNPSPAIDPGAPGGGSGTWTYFHGNGDYTTSTTLPAGANPELPDGGFGWVNPLANHIGLWKFTVNSKPKGVQPPADYNENGVVDAADYVAWRDNLGAANSLPNDDTAGVGEDDYDRWRANFGNVAGNDTTNFGVGDVGGHGTTGARWTTDHAAEFLIEWLGYNGRNQETDGGQHAGRLTFLRMTDPDGVDLDVQPIIGGVQDGSSMAYTNSATLMLDAGDTLTLSNEGGDWVGLDLTLTELPISSGAKGSVKVGAVPEPSAVALAALAGVTAICLRLRRTKSGARSADCCR